MTEKTQDAAFFAQPQRRVKAASCFVLAGVCLAAAWLMLQGEESDPATGKGRSGKNAIEAEDATSFVVRKDGRKLWEFAAKRIEVSADYSYATAKDVRQAILYKEGRPQWRMRASNVRLNQRTNDVEASGSVGATGPNGLIVNTRQAVWLQKPQRLVCPQPVKAALRGMKVTSGSAAYDLARDELHCAEAVTVSSATAVLKAPRATARPKDGTVSFEGGVDILIRRRVFTQG